MDMPMEPPAAIAGPCPGGMLRSDGLGRDIVAGLALAAITIPEQMATARARRLRAAARASSPSSPPPSASPVRRQPPADGGRGFDDHADLRRGAGDACRERAAWAPPRRCWRFFVGGCW